MFNQDSKLLKGKYLFNSKLLEILKGSCLIKDGTNTQIVKETKKTKLDLPRAGQTGPSAPAGLLNDVSRPVGLSNVKTKHS